MSSFKGDGGIVSTASDCILFLQAFFGGQFCSSTQLIELYDWNKLFFPLEYGVGIMRFQLPRVMTGFRLQSALLGHSGLSGAFAFYAPDLDTYIAGTVNQIHKPQVSFKLLIKVLQKLKATR